MNESVFKTIGVAFGVCLICSLIVSTSAVGLRDQQKENKLNDRRVKILEVADIKVERDQTIAEAFKKLEQKFIDFDTGILMDEYKNFNIDEYDQLMSLKDSTLSKPIPSSEDIAIIKNRENVGKIFILRNDVGNIDKLILPIRGYGLWGTLFGYIAIDGDFNTVSGITYYEHKETPGLGAEVDNIDWRKSWIGKKIYQDNQVALTVIKGKVSNDDPSKTYKVDGLSGATITGRGVSNMITYWFGNSGYAKLFAELDYES